MSWLFSLTLLGNRGLYSVSNQPNGIKIGILPLILWQILKRFEEFHNQKPVLHISASSEISRKWQSTGLSPGITNLELKKRGNLKRAADGATTENSFVGFYAKGRGSWSQVNMDQRHTSMACHCWQGVTKRPQKAEPIPIGNTKNISKSLNSMHIKTSIVLYPYINIYDIQ